MHKCPKCKSVKIGRSRSRSTWETWRKELTPKRVFRCRDCGFRGWGYDDGPTFDPKDIESAQAALVQAPGLNETPLSDRERQAEIDVASLDRF